MYEQISTRNHWELTCLHSTTYLVLGSSVCVCMRTRSSSVVKDSTCRGDLLLFCVSDKTASTTLTRAREGLGTCAYYTRVLYVRTYNAVTYIYTQGLVVGEEPRPHGGRGFKYGHRVIYLKMRRGQ